MVGEKRVCCPPPGKIGLNSVKRLIFDLTRIPFRKRLIGIFRLIVKVVNDRNLFT